jgi:hypothetical protein
LHDDLKDPENQPQKRQKVKDSASSARIADARCDNFNFLGEGDDDSISAEVEGEEDDNRAAASSSSHEHSDQADEKVQTNYTRRGRIVFVF